ncbi:hypothetical protein ILUMI_21051 [Ignelater luminosus]|uniref:Retrotransposon gag domain-containing protein n=1 Tax=Ignelater luminosus TaxID=2038154 RepID=A0A8K0G1S1_IGNLU|nr:hypothetical protein ILUMI_21051 [Ignelater luminosus]
MTYLQATEIIKKQEATKFAQLLTLIGDEGIRIFNTFTFMGKEKNKLDPLIKKFNEHFNPKRNLAYERHKFLTCRQKEGQTIDQYITELKNLSQLYELKELRESLIKDVLICGLCAESIHQKLLEGTSETLDDVVKISINIENTSDHRQITNGHGTEVDFINHSKQTRRPEHSVQDKKKTYKCKKYA